LAGIGGWFSTDKHFDAVILLNIGQFFNKAMLLKPKFCYFLLDVFDFPVLVIGLLLLEFFYI
jgi:hypothetical protein